MVVVWHLDRATVTTENCRPRSITGGDPVRTYHNNLPLVHAYDDHDHDMMIMRMMMMMAAFR